MKGRKWLAISLAVSMAFAMSGCAKQVEDEKLVIKINGKNETVLYTGTVNDQKPDGDATFTSEDKSWSGEGTFSDGDFQKGTVKGYPMDVKIGDDSYDGTYTGAADASGLTGDGKFEASDYDLSYDGSWKSSEMADKGAVTNFPVSLTLTNTVYSGDYSGDVKDGKPDGTGDFSFDDGESQVSYSGGWSNGEPAGEGELTDNDYNLKRYADGDSIYTGSYEGATTDGLPTNGTFSCSDDGEGDPYTYTGEWANGTFNGVGTLTATIDGLDNDYTGNYEDGYWNPTTAQVMKSFGTYPKMSYNVSDANMKFIDANPDIFPYVPEQNKVDWNSFIDSGITYRQYIKNPSNYNSKLMKTPVLYVVQVTEYNLGTKNSEPYTEIIGQNLNNIEDEEVYYCFYPGDLTTLYRGSKVRFVGLPLDNSTYEDTSNGQTNCIVMLMSGIS